MYRRLRKLATFLLVLPLREKLLVLEIAWEMARARLELLRVPFREIAATLGEPGRETPEEAPPDRLPPRVGGHVRSLSTVLPWECRCLVQALAARRVLQRRGCPTTLYLGVRRRGEGLEAHAFLRWGSRILTGAEERETYRVIATFA